MFQPKGQTNSNFYAFSETQEHIAQTLRADTEWSSSQEVIQAIATLKEQHPEMPQKPDPIYKQKDAEGKPIGDPYYDDVELTEWKTDHSQWKTKVVSYDNRYKTAAGLIFQSYCSQEMKRRLTGQSDYYTTVEQDPVAMLLRIRTICQQGTSQEQAYHRMVTQFQRTINQKQGENESTDSYLKRVEDDIDQLFATNGTEFVDHHTRQLPNYTAIQEDMTIQDEEERKQRYFQEQEWFLETGRHNFKAMVAYLGLQRGEYSNYQEIGRASCRERVSASV